MKYVAVQFFNIAFVAMGIILPIITATVDKDAEEYLAVVVSSYNNEAWCIKNMDSLLSQKYDNYHIFYYDDCSSDATHQKVSDYISDMQVHEKVTLIRNQSRRGALAGIYHAVHNLPNDAIVLTMDGDDWLAHDSVFSTINAAHHQEDIYISYGQFREWPSNRKGFCRTIPQEIVQNNAYRDYDWITSQLRTFRAGLFKQIHLKDLLFNGHFFKVAWDLGFMFPILEMAKGRAICIEDVIYIYNCNNPINDFKVNCTEQNNTGRIIRTWQRYKSMDSETLKEWCSPSEDMQKSAIIVLSTHANIVVKALSTLPSKVSSHSTVYVFYDSASKDFSSVKNQFGNFTYLPVHNNQWSVKINEIVHNAAYTSCVLLDERTVLSPNMPLENCLRTLEQTKAAACHVAYAYTALQNQIFASEHINKNIYAWQKEYSTGSAAQPYQPGIAYRTEHLLTKLPQTPVTSLSEWWQSFSKETIAPSEVLLGYAV